MKSFSPVFFFLLLPLFPLIAEGTPETAPRPTDNHFSIAIQSSDLELDPHFAVTVPDYHLFSALFEGLFVYDPETGEGKPGLASRWSTDETGTVYTFELRQTTWSDGEPITADDVVGSWLRALSPETGSPHSWLLETYIAGAREYARGENGREEVGIKAVDRLKFQLRLVRPISFLEQLLPHQAFAVLPMQLVDRYGDDWADPKRIVGNGPFILEQYSSGDGISCTVNSAYWDREGVFLDRVTFLPVPDPSDAFQRYINGEVDWNTVIARGDLERLQRMRSFHRFPVNGTLFMIIAGGGASDGAGAVKTGLPDGEEARQGLALALDRSVIAESLPAGTVVPARSFIPEMYNYPGITGLPEHNRKEAARLFHAAAAEARHGGDPEKGPEREGPARFSLLFFSDPLFSSLAEAAAGQWEKALAVETVRKGAEWEEYTETLFEGEFDIVLGSWFGEFQDPEAYIGDLFFDYLTSVLAFKDARLEDLRSELRNGKRGVKRTELIEQIERRLLNRHIVVPLFRYTACHIIDLEKWGGWHPNGLDVHPLKEIFLAGRSRK